MHAPARSEIQSRIAVIGRRFAYGLANTPAPDAHAQWPKREYPNLGARK